MSNGFAHMFAGASQAGEDFGVALSGPTPNEEVVRRTVRKSLACAGNDKSRRQIARVVDLLGLGMVRLNSL